MSKLHVGEVLAVTGAKLVRSILSLTFLEENSLQGALGYLERVVVERHGQQKLVLLYSGNELQNHFSTFVVHCPSVNDGRILSSALAESAAQLRQCIQRGYRLSVGYEA